MQASVLAQSSTGELISGTIGAEHVLTPGCKAPACQTAVRLACTVATQCVTFTVQ